MNVFLTAVFFFMMVSSLFPTQKNSAQKDYAISSVDNAVTAESLKAQKDRQSHQRQTISDDVFDQEFLFGVKLHPGESIAVYINGEITSFNVKKYSTLEEKTKQGDDREIFDQEFEIGIKLEPGKSVSVNTNGEVTIRDAGEARNGKASVAKIQNRPTHTAAATNGQIGSTLDRAVSRRAPLGGAPGDKDTFIEELPGGVMIRPGEKVTFFTSGVVSRQKIMRDSRDGPGTTHLMGERPPFRSSGDRDIFEADLEGGIMLHPGDRVFFREDGGIAWHQKPRDEGLAALHTGPEKPAGYLPDRKEKNDIFQEELSGGIALGPGKSVSVDANGEVTIRDAGTTRGGKTSAAKTKNRPAHTAAVTNGQTDNTLDRAVRGRTPAGGAPGDKDMFIEELPGGVMIRPGEKVTFFTSGVVSRQKIMRDSRVIAGTTQLVRGRPPLGSSGEQDIFEADLEGGIMLHPGDRVFFREDGGIAWHQKPMDEGLAALHTGTGKTADCRMNGQEKGDIFREELTGGIALGPGEGVAVYVNGETVRYSSMKKETAAEIVTALNKDGETK